MLRHALRIVPLILIAVLAVLAWRVPGVPAAEIRYVRIGAGAANTVSFQGGAALASALTRPPGMPPCADGQPCGVTGVVALTQSLDSSQDIIRAVATGSLETGLAPAQMVFGARCPSRAEDPRADLAILGDFYAEALHVLVRPDLGIASVADIRGHRVAVGDTGSETRRLADRMLMAHGLRRADIRMVPVAKGDAIAAMARGEVDVLFRISSWPDADVADLMAAGAAALLPVTGAGADALMGMHPFAGPGRIPAGLYGEAGEVETLLQPVVWFSRPDLPPALAASLAEALARPANRLLLAGRDEELQVVEAAGPRLGAPLHPGAAAAYGAAGQVLPCPGE